jgi:hypothetical protein
MQGHFRWLPRRLWLIPAVSGRERPIEDNAPIQTTECHLGSEQEIAAACDNLALSPFDYYPHRSSLIFH